MSRDAYIPCLFRLFRQYGYDGATLAKMSEATGLGKASLYHHFPGGKDEMVEVVLSFLESQLERHIFQTLNESEDASVQIEQMVENLQTIYDGGREPCVLAILLLGSARDVFHDKVKELLKAWIGAIATLLVKSGMDEQSAYQRSEAALTTIQGALILSQGLDDPSLFQRAIRKLPEVLCQVEVTEH